MILLAHSFGGIISLMYSSLFPENVEKLILLDILMPLFEAETHTKNRLKQSIMDHSNQGYSDSSYKTYTSVDVVANVRAKVTDLNVENSKLIVSRNLTQTENGVVWRTDPKLKLSSSWRYSFQQVNSMIGLIEVPVFAVFGHQSKAYLQCDVFKDKFTSLVTKVIRGGHHIHMDSPKPVASAIRSFIDH